MTRNAVTSEEIAANLNRLSDSIEQDKLNTAYHLARSGQYSQAQREIENLRFSDISKRIETALLLGKIFAQQGLLDKAADCWNFVLKTEPKNQEAHLGLAAIARQSADPMPLRLFKFVAGCLFVFLVALVFSVYIKKQLVELDFHIAAIESNHISIAAKQQREIEERFREFGSQIANIESTYLSLTAKQQKLIEDHIGSLKQDYAGVSAKLSEIDDALTLKLDLINETTDKHFRSLQTEVAENLTNLKKMEADRNKEMTSRKSTLTSDVVNNSLAMSKKADLAFRQLKDDLLKIEANTNLNIKAIDHAWQKQRMNSDANRKVIEGRIAIIEQQLEAIDASLDTVKTNILSQTTNDKYK